MGSESVKIANQKKNTQVSGQVCVGQWPDPQKSFILNPRKTKKHQQLPELQETDPGNFQLGVSKK